MPLFADVAPEICFISRHWSWQAVTAGVAENSKTVWIHQGRVFNSMLILTTLSVSKATLIGCHPTTCASESLDAHYIPTRELFLGKLYCFTIELNLFFDLSLWLTSWRCYDDDYRTREVSIAIFAIPVGYINFRGIDVPQEFFTCHSFLVIHIPVVLVLD